MQFMSHCASFSHNTGWSLEKREICHQRFIFTKNNFFKVFQRQMLYYTQRYSKCRPCTSLQRLNLEIQARVAF